LFLHIKDPRKSGGPITLSALSCVLAMNIYKTIVVNLLGSDIMCFWVPVFTHCYGHALSLACGDAIKHCKIL